MMKSMSQLSKVSQSKSVNYKLYYANINTSPLLYLEIIGYAEFLGMDLTEDRDLLYIAEEGLKAPVPEPWKAFSNE